MNIKYINNKLKENLSNKRYEHSLLTANESKKLAKKYNVDGNKAYLAGLLHDCAKDLSKKQLQGMLENKGYNKEFLNSKTIMHAPVGAIIAQNDYDVKDKTVLDAIKYHCYARKEMTLIEKVVFVADKIEPSRKYNDIKKLRDLAYKNIDEALLYFISFTINKIKKNKGYLHYNTIEASKYYKNIIENNNNI